MSTAISNATAQATEVPSATNASLTTLSNNFGSFLKLLTTQLQNQDPLSPMESHEFTNQLVMFAEAEQAIATNQKLDSLVEIGQKNEASQALSYHGKEVRVNGNQLSFHGEPVSFQYTVPSGMVSGDLVVRDADGKVVYEKSLEGSQFKEGLHNLSWDGRNEYGYQLAKGLYSVAVSGKNGAGEPVSASDMSVTGSVKGVEYSDGQTWLDMGFYQVTLDNVASTATPAFQVEDQVRAMNFVGSNVHITGTTAPIKNGQLSLAYNTSGVSNFTSALSSEPLSAVSLKFYDQSGRLVTTKDITAQMDASKLSGGEKRIDMTVAGLADNDYRVEMQVDFAGSGTTAGSTFNKIPMGYSGKVRRVVFDSGEARLEINGVLYNPRDVGSVLGNDTPIFTL